MIESIEKLNSKEIKPYLMHLHFNAYLLKDSFQMWVITLKDHQDKVLRKLDETTIAKKLRLGINFTREAFNLRKKAIGIGLIKPKHQCKY